MTFIIDDNLKVNAIDVVGVTSISANLAIDTNTLLVDAANKRVGIACTTPTTALDVVGDTTLSANLSLGSSFNMGGNEVFDTSNRLKINNPNFVSAAPGVYVANGDPGHTTLSVDARHLVLMSSQNVGLSFLPGATGHGNIYWAKSGDVRYGFIRGNFNSDYMQFQWANDEAMRIYPDKVDIMKDLTVSNDNNSGAVLKISSVEDDAFTNHQGRIDFQNTNINDTFIAARVQVNASTDAARNGVMQFFTNNDGTTSPELNLTKRYQIDQNGDHTWFRDDGTSIGMFFDASSGGLSFGTTPGIGGTVTGNQLDYYEEGTWTPDLHFNTSKTGITYSSQDGTYTRIGNIVFCRFIIILTSKGTATGVPRIYGLPFAVVGKLLGTNLEGEGGISYFNNKGPESGIPHWVPMQSGTFARLYLVQEAASGDTPDASEAIFENNSSVRGYVWYYAA